MADLSECPSIGIAQLIGLTAVLNELQCHSTYGFSYVYLNGFAQLYSIETAFIGCIQSVPIPCLRHGEGSSHVRRCPRILRSGIMACPTLIDSIKSGSGLCPCDPLAACRSLLGGWCGSCWFPRLLACSLARVLAFCLLACFFVPVCFLAFLLLCLLSWLACSLAFLSAGCLGLQVMEGSLMSRTSLQECRMY